jgi:hypothetical protein
MSDNSHFLEVFSVRDLKAGTYGQPFALSSRGVAIRTFTSWVSDPNSFFSKFPHDFELFHVGHFDSDHGRLIPLDVPDYVARASELVPQVHPEG